MKYLVKFDVVAKFLVEIDAKNKEEAIEKAEMEFSNADFGDAYKIDGEIATIEEMGE